MNVKLPFLVSVLTVLISCHKQTADPNGPPEDPVNPHSFIALKLTDISIDGLPAPYYHFDYLDDRHISDLNFGNGLLYKMTYAGDNLTLMKNNTANTSEDSVLYNYINNRVTSIYVTTDSGFLYHRAFLTYFASGQLQKLEWELKQADQAFANEQSFTFTYYPDGNVKEIMHQYFAIGSLPAASFTDRYENYDTQKNTDGFTLVHASINQYKHPILLPGIILQVNNPGRVVRSGNAAVDYEVNYVYRYDAKDRPLEKTGDFLYTSGPEAGQHDEVLTHFSYHD